MEIVTADIGGTHARFALAELSAGKVVAVGTPITLKTADHPTLEGAWAYFAASAGKPLPPRAAIAVACPIEGDVLKLTNSPWVIRPAQLRAHLGLEHMTLLNDFGAISRAVVSLDSAHFRNVHGPDVPLPDQGVVTIVGPGTGLGVAHVLREGGRDHVIECEGGHIGFAPQDAVEDAILAHLRRTFPRVSAERLVSGSGLGHIYAGLAAIQGVALQSTDDRLLWNSALDGSDLLATAAMERFCQCLGAVAGDLALAHGAKAVVIAGGLGRRLAEVLPESGFGARFIAKGRFEPLMATIPVKLIMHPEPGLLGAASAYAGEFQ